MQHRHSHRIRIPVALTERLLVPVLSDIMQIALDKRLQGEVFFGIVIGLDHFSRFFHFFPDSYSIGELKRDQPDIDPQVG